jgi:D-alanyl-D-alanine-carboxypeptidase/D-alanyl-D-alanine-endopeptidase
MKTDTQATCVIDGARIETQLGRAYSGAPLVEWASVTKTVTAATMLLVLQEARVDERTPVSELVPHLLIAGAFSVGDLIDHTSGLPRVHPGMSSGLVGDPYAGVDRATVFECLKTDTAPGGRPREYSNLGYALLGEIIETMTGTSWFDACAERVLAPAGVTTATIDPVPSDRVVLSTWRGKVREPWNLSRTPYVAAGGLWSTLDDIARHGASARSTNPDLRGWEHRDGLVWHSGQTRDSGACLVVTRTGAIAAHTLGRLPHAADKIAVSMLRP